MWYELKFGLIGFVVGTLAISAATFASSITASPIPVHSPAERIALAPLLKPAKIADNLAAPASVQAAPMSAWRRAYIAKHGHQPPAA